MPHSSRSDSSYSWAAFRLRVTTLTSSPLSALAIADSTSMPRFAILAHDHPAPHWDLFLEAGPVLRSWRLAGPLVVNTPIAAAPAPDHRLVYLDYEGPVSGG